MKKWHNLRLIPRNSFKFLKRRLETKTHINQPSQEQGTEQGIGKPLLFPIQRANVDSPDTDKSDTTNTLEFTVLKLSSPKVSHYSGINHSSHTDQRSRLKNTRIHQNTRTQSRLPFWAPSWLAQRATINGFDGFIQSASTNKRHENSPLPAATSPFSPHKRFWPNAFFHHLS